MNNLVKRLPLYLTLAGFLTVAAQGQAQDGQEFDLNAIGDALNRLEESRQLRADPFAEETDAGGTRDEATVAPVPLKTISPYANDSVILQLQGLDKVTARTTSVAAQVGKITTFGSLQIVARYCRETPPTEAPETWAFLEITEVKDGLLPTKLFSGWMIASSPGLSSLAHPVYDIVVKGCGRVVAEDSGTPPPAAPAEEAVSNPASPEVVE